MLIWVDFGYVLATFPYVKPHKKPSLDPPPTFPTPSGAWARSTGTLAQVWVDRSVQPDCTASLRTMTKPAYRSVRAEGHQTK